MGESIDSCASCGGLLSPSDVECSNCGTVRAALEPTSLRAPNSGIEIFEGKWAIESKIGEGGMGSVFLATDLQLDRKVAIKTLSKAICQDESMVARFEREAKMMAKLDHPNLVPIHAVGRHENVPFIVMKLLEGATLSEYMRKQDRLPMSEVVALMKQICAGLGFVHARGITHRDIKPANIFLSAEGHVTLLDLGVAHDPKTSTTRTGVMMGTPRYMSPEQILGAKVDQRTDLYALGVVLYEMIAGKLPFDGDSDFSVMKAHTDSPPPDPTADLDLPKAIGSVTMRALAKKPDERFQSAAELFAALEAAARSATDSDLVTPKRRAVRQRATPAPVSRPPVAPRLAEAPPSAAPGGTRIDSEMNVRRSSAPLIGGVAVTIVLIGGGLFFALRHPPAEPVAAVELISETQPKAAVESPAQPQQVKEVTPVADAKAAEDVKPVAEVKPVANVKPVADVRPVEKKPVAVARREESSSAHGPGEVLVSVTVNGAPSWAWLDVDGMRQGATPKKLKLDSGKHVIHLERPQFKSVDLDVTVTAGEAKKLPLKLEPL